MLGALAAVAVAPSASAATFVRTGSTTGSTYSGAISAWQEGSSTILGSDGSGSTASCSSGSLTGDVGASGGATVTGTLTVLTLGSGSGCSSNFVLDHCSLAADGPVTVTATGAGTGTLTVSSLKERCFTVGGLVLCDFNAADATGTITDKGVTGSTLTFTSVPVTSSNGSACPSTAKFSGSYFPIRAEPAGSLLYINNA